MRVNHVYVPIFTQRKWRRERERSIRQEREKEKDRERLRMQIIGRMRNRRQQREERFKYFQSSSSPKPETSARSVLPESTVVANRHTAARGGDGTSLSGDGSGPGMTGKWGIGRVPPSHHMLAFNTTEEINVPVHTATSNVTCERLSGCSTLRGKRKEVKGCTNTEARTGAAMHAGAHGMNGADTLHTEGVSQRGTNDSVLLHRKNTAGANGRSVRDAPTPGTSSSLFGRSGQRQRQRVSDLLR